MALESTITLPHVAVWRFKSTLSSMTDHSGELVDQRSREPLAGVSEIVEYFGYKSEQAIYDQRYRGVGVGALGFKVGKQLRFRWSDIDAFIEAQSAAARDAAK